MRIEQDIRYEPDERCPPAVSIGVGLQGVLLILAPVVVNVATVMRAGGQPESYLTWAVFTALLIGGTITALQAVRLGRVGAGHVLITGPGPIFIAICIAALVQGGPAMMASLIVVSSLLQFAFSAWLPLLRRMITPVVSGTVIMLIAATVVPIALDLLDDVPQGAPVAAAPCVAGVTLLVATALALRAAGPWRLWSPLIGIAAGCAAAAAFGLYDFQRVLDAPWIGIPDVAWQGLNLTPGVEFWSLVPVFATVTLVLTINTISDGIVIQSASRRSPRATDFRIVQGTLNANGVGVLISGIAGTLPTMGYTAGSTALISLTGVAARSVGYCAGAIFMGLAFLPKLTAVLLIIPGPVAGVYFMILMAVLFVAGARMVLQDGFDFRNATIAGLAFWIGVGVENQSIFAGYLHGPWSAVFGHGMTVGALTAIVLTVFMELTNRPRRLEVELSVSALPRIDAFLRSLGDGLRWNEASTERLCAAGEETLSSLLQSGNGEEPRLLLVARAQGRIVEMEYVAVSEEESIEDRLAYLSEQPETPEESEISFRLLRHYASSVRHRKYHGIDVVTVQVEGSRRE
ncbi:MAG: hypothetical protein OXC01_15970 [Immundisolibacterales bacterium]|nr:hypothetical protein [Immundisolibacterales bacterium]